jgi:HlyD family secretion protein
MRRMAVGFVLAILVLSALLGVRIVRNRWALHGPPGGSGVVEGTTVRASSRVGGRIDSVFVIEGQVVNEGEVLVRLDCVEPNAALVAAQAQVLGSRGQAMAASEGASAAGDAIGAARAAVAAADAQARALGAQADAAQRQADRLDAVPQDVSESQRDQARAGAVGLEAQVQAAQSQKRAGQAQTRAATGSASAASAQAEAAAQGVVAAQAQLDRAQLAVDECDVRSPRTGTVRLLPFEEGELVGPGMTLASIVDLSVVHAAFYLPNAELAAAQAGGTAIVRADAWPDTQFQGIVATVATEPEFTPRNIQTRTDRDRLVYRVEVDVPNPDGALRPGMPVEVELQAVAL